MKQKDGHPLTSSILMLKISFVFCWKDKKISRKKKIIRILIALLSFLIIGIEKVLLNKVIYFFELLKKVFSTRGFFGIHLKHIFTLGKNTSS